MTARSLPPDPRHDAGAASNAGAEASYLRSDQAQALESYRRLTRVIDDYRSSVAEDAGQLGRLKSRIMEVLEHELARGPSVGLITPLGRDYAMTLAALRAEVRAAVDAEPGVHTRRVHITDAHPDRMSLDLRITITMSSRSSLSDLPDRLRGRIAERLRGGIGLHTETIDLIAEDIYDD